MIHYFEVNFSVFVLLLSLCHFRYPGYTVLSDGLWPLGVDSFSAALNHTVYSSYRVLLVHTIQKLD